MSAETSENLSKVDSAVQDQPKKRRATSMAADVEKINELEAKGEKLEIAVETQGTGWKLNTSPVHIDDPDILKLPLTKPKVNKIDLHFPLGLEVTARNMKGVTIKDALDAIHKQFKKKADDELDAPYLAGFEWDPEESWTRLKVHQSMNSTAKPVGGGKKKKKGGDS